MESVLIMGGSDFIGKSLAKHFIKHQHKVDVLTTGRVDYEGVNRHFSCDRKNIEELEKALKDNEYTYIYDMTVFLKSEIEDLFGLHSLDFPLDKPDSDDPDFQTADVYEYIRVLKFSKTSKDYYL